MPAPVAEKIGKYGRWWGPDVSPLFMELDMIRRGGYTLTKSGKKEGLGLFQHFMNARKLLWPRRWRHKWVDLIYESIIANEVTILMGPFSCGKTSIASEYALIRYWASPHNTMVLMSTTSMDKLKQAVFGEVLMLFSAARKLYPWLSGNPLDFKCAITTDKLDEDNDVRDMRKGMFGKACYEGNRYIGLGSYSGIKQDNIIFIADELQFMAPTFFDCLPNMIGSVATDANNQPQIKIIGSGNPKHDPFDQLGVAAEPLAGWSSSGLIERTTVWKTKFHNGCCVNLIGTDSPNFDVPETATIPFNKLVNRETIKRVETRWGRESLKFNEQCVGRMMIGFAGNRVITMEICQKHGAMERAYWRDTTRTKIAYLDPSWTEAGDRCIFGWLEFGTANSGNQIIRFGADMIIPLVGGTRDEPDEQIALFCQKQLTELGIVPENLFYGSTGRGTTGAAFAKVFGNRVPVPIAEGGMPSLRPVRHDLFIDDRGTRRHKRCDEEYHKFITELWFATRNVIECGQMRELTEEVIREGCARQYTTTATGKIEVESKEEMKETLGFSPDKYDGFTFGIEGARQRGFKIQRLGEEIIVESPADDWLEKEQESYRDAMRSGALTHA